MVLVSFSHGVLPLMCASFSVVCIFCVQMLPFMLLMYCFHGVLSIFVGEK